VKALTHFSVLLLLVATPAIVCQQAESDKPQPRVFVTDSDSWQVSGGSGGGYSGFSGGFGGGSSGGARPQTAEVIKTMGERCPHIIVNNRLEASDYVLRLEHEGGKGILRKQDKVAVFVRKSGDAIFSKSTLSVGGSVQGACEAIGAHWTANAAALAAMPDPNAARVVAAVVPAATQPAMASLTVESNIAGADIEVDGEFVGNAPSTVSVTPGKHTISIKKKGYADWSRTMNVSGSNVRLSAELETKS
jgi:hypothetical protein